MISDFSVLEIGQVSIFKFTMRILIENTKHGDQYYDVSTDTKLGLVCLALLRLRYEEGWYEAEKEKPTAPDFAESTIKSLPASMQAQATNAWERFKFAKRSYDAERAFLDELTAVLESKEHASTLASRAYQLLCSRNDAQYEGVQTEDLDDPRKFSTHGVEKGITYLPAGKYVVREMKNNDTTRRAFVGAVCTTEGGTGPSVKITLEDDTKSVLLRKSAVASLAYAGD